METTNKIKTTEHTPIVRIGIVQSKDKVTVSCDQNFSIMDLAGRLLFFAVAKEKYDFIIDSSQPATINYQIRFAIFKDKEQAYKKLGSLHKKGLPAQLRIVGMKIPFRNKIIDNRDYWVTIGNFSSKEQASQFYCEQKLSCGLEIVEEITKRASGMINMGKKKLGDRIKVIPEQMDSLITIEDVPIGIEFHWQRKETLAYRGTIEIGLNNEGKLEVINELDLENYLTSVNSSEMTTDCPLSLLQAQTVAARSTVLATMGKHHYNQDYHLCADDHCQCYQGAWREQDLSRLAVTNTFGEVLMYDDEVCDARYSKICGGIMESYPNVWEDHNVPYLIAGIDSDQPMAFPANTEQKAKQFIDGNPPAFCNTNLYQLPSRLANLYSTQNLFRWQVDYRRQELEELITQKLNIDLGELLDIKPLLRGASGRLIYIELVGSKKKIKIGKELEIRRILSKSHLYSSCFYVEKKFNDDGRIERFILKGAGWGHGVGLCQVGATVMALKGYPYKDILKHYYKNSKIIRIY